MEMAAPACYRHPNEPTRIVCQRCGRPICPQCMVPGSVGFQCPECVQQGMRQTRQNKLPYGGNRGTNPKTTSIVLAAINAVVWVILMLSGGYSGVPMAYLSLSPSDVAFGGAWWQLITSGFSHVEVWHIGFNMLALWMLGPLIEKLLGRSRFLAIYFIAALAGSGVAVLFSPTFGMTLGASGAIFGLMGAVLLIAIKHQGNVRSILIWLGLNVAITVTNLGQISWEGHLGGFLGGLAATAAVIYLPKDKRSWQWPLLILLGLGSIALSVITALQR